MLRINHQASNLLTMPSSPSYQWLCHSCSVSNGAGVALCAACGHPANSSASAIRSRGDAAKVSTAAPATELVLEFNGKAGEYFRLWIVNLCLTLLTCGVFSAWAKVRKKRYFYSHTILDGTPFQYLAKPLPIFKGRVVAAILFVTYYAASHFFTSLLPIVIVAALIVAPWAIARSAAFNARYSAYRNLCFSFSGDYRGAIAAIYWLGLIPAIAIGSAFEWWGQVAYGAIPIVIFGIVFPWWLARFRTYQFNNSGYGGIDAAIEIRGGQYWGIYFRGGLIMMLGAALAAGMAFALAVPLKRYPMIVAPIGALGVYLGYAAGYAYIQAASGNLVWNNTRLGPLRFVSTLHGGDLAWLYLSNALAIIASCALLTPWAVIRTLKYRAAHLRVLRDGELTAFAGGEVTAVRAAGSEVSEFFDLDLSL